MALPPITPLVWRRDLEPQLRRALGDALADIRAEVAQGQCQLWQVGHCLAVTRTEVLNGHKELVGVALVGTDGKAAVTALAELGRFNGCQSARIHCQNPAIVRLYRQTGQHWQEVERVYRLNLQEMNPHGRP